MGWHFLGALVEGVVVRLYTIIIRYTRLGDWCLVTDGNIHSRANPEQPPAPPYYVFTRCTIICLNVMSNRELQEDHGPCSTKAWRTESCLGSFKFQLSSPLPQVP